MLEAGSTLVREWRESDAGQLAVQANDRRVWLGLRDAFPHPYRIDDAHTFIGMATKMLPRTLFAIEVDGYGARSTRRRFQSDLDRQNDLVGRGWTVLRFTWNDVVRRPDHVAKVILEEIGRAHRRIRA